jgi:hypothetical protein
MRDRRDDARTVSGSQPLMRAACDKHTKVIKLSQTISITFGAERTLSRSSERIGRGLDFNQKPDSWFAIGTGDFSLHKCLETKVDIFRKPFSRDRYL